MGRPKAARRLTMSAEAANPQLATTSLFVEALNDMIDTFAKRLTAERNHVPHRYFYARDNRHDGYWLFELWGAVGRHLQ